jgi:hypothetical protein
MLTMIPAALLASAMTDPPLLAGAGARACSAPAAKEEILVCGEPKQSPYRIDPAVTAVTRKGEELGVRVPDRDPTRDPPCPSYGLKICEGRDTIPVLAIARVAAESASLALSGQDWREPLRTGLDHYEEYRTAKAKDERRRSDRRIRVGVGARPRQ